MKSIFALALLASLVAAQGDGVPDCAKPCVAKFTSGDNIGGCKSLDVGCICSNSKFLESIACCLEGVCDEAGKNDAVQYAKSICTSQGVTVPDEVVCRDSASTSSTSPATASTNTPSPASKSNASGSPTESSSTETESPGAASGLQVTGGLFGAVVAMLMAL